MKQSYNKERIKTSRYLKSKNPKYLPTHVLDRYFECVKRFDVEYDEQGLDIFYPQSMADQQQLSSTIVIAVGGTHPTKRIPDKLVEVLCNRRDYQYTLIGGPDIEKENFRQYDHVQNRIGALSIKESIQVVAQAQLVISGDTGFMHIAAALSKPMIVLWGSTSPEMGFRPIYGDHLEASIYQNIILRLPCQPCSKYGEKVCPLDHMDCLNLINAEDVISSIDKILQRDKIDE